MDVRWLNCWRRHWRWLSHKREEALKRSATERRRDGELTRERESSRRERRVRPLTRDRWLERETADERDRRREREKRERESKRARRTRVRRARACPNIGDTQEAKRARPEASTERGQSLVKERSESDRSGEKVSVSNHRHHREWVTSSYSPSNTIYKSIFYFVL